jgi:hypothetical protein
LPHFAEFACSLPILCRLILPYRVDIRREGIMQKSKSLQVTATEILAGRQHIHITDTQAEGVYGVPRKSLQNMRVLGEGPRYRKFGARVRYKVADFEAWLESLPSGGAGIPASALKDAR